MTKNLSFDLEGFNGKDPLQFQLIFKKYYEDLYGTVRYFTGDEESTKDIMSDLFMKLYEKIEKETGAFNEEEHIAASLKLSARRAVIDYKRAKDSNPILHTGSLPEMPQEEDIEREMTRTYVLTRLRRSIEALPPQQKVVIKMLYLEDMKVKEVALALNLSRSAVYTHKDLALRQLRETLPPGSKDLLFYLLLLALINLN